MALEYLGSDGLLQAVVDMWISCAPPPRPLVEHLSTNEVSQKVLNILKIAKQRVGAVVPGRTPDAGTVTVYASHASNLADGLITLLPKVQLSRALRGSCIEIELGI